jgi:hypothetical protein
MPKISGPDSKNVKAVEEVSSCMIGLQTKASSNPWQNELHGMRTSARNEPLFLTR